MTRVSFTQNTFMNNNNWQQTPILKLQPPSCLESSSYLDSINKVSFAPTKSDVLLGRGVATNRHRGNEMFRKIVSEHVDAYMSSTKKQKMTISRSIVDHIRTELNPPGKFLDKNSMTGLWHEVDDKRAFEKTAQALRDIAAPLRKRKQEVARNENKVVSAESPTSSNSKRLHTSSTGPEPKKQRFNSAIASISGIAVPNNMQETQSCMSIMEGTYGSSPVLSGPVLGSTIFNQELIQSQDDQLAQALTYNCAQQIDALHSQSPVASTPLNKFASCINSAMVGLTNINMVNDLPCLPPTPITSSCETFSVETSISQQLVYDKQMADEDEFAREMGPDEYFFEIGNSDPICTEFDEYVIDESVFDENVCDDSVFDESVFDSVFEDQ